MPEPNSYREHKVLNNKIQKNSSINEILNQTLASMKAGNSTIDLSRRISPITRGGKSPTAQQGAFRIKKFDLTGVR